MDRSLAGRPALGPLTLGRARSWQLPGGAGRTLRALLARLWRRRATRIALIAALVAVPVIPGGWLLLRNSSLVSVEKVQISGVHGAEAKAIEAALTRAGKSMTTLHMNTAALRAAVAPFRVVRSLSAQPSFPHGLRIEVLEQLPVAALVTGAGRTAVAADGVVLGQALLSSALPTVKGWQLPVAGGQLRDEGLLGALSVLGAAPKRLARRVERVYVGGKGVTAVMRNGLLVYFGDGSLPHAKWLALAAVLASTSSTGAVYVDVRVPSHPAAGFPPGGGPAVTEAQGTSGSESAVGSIAEGLEREGGASATSSKPATSGETSSSTTSSGTEAPASGETGAASSGETGSSESSEASAETPATGG